ncbi:MAG: TAXI family TRAP transporter solute-binding subunit [Neisseriaceae bacterium]|nr:TAXI family TRAP transporter solute-binding subunit [Neisseriaceae bacterium]MBP6863004.1 TAXI family TRAP transporter solute-binding subunit [Neisseriaceae bacterium]
MKPNALKSSLAILALSALLSACGGQSGGSAATAEGEGLDATIVTIATGGASGPYNIIGTTLAEVYRDLYGVNAKTQTTGASIENMNLLAQGKAELALVMSDVVTESINGSENFPNKITNVQQVAAIYPNYVQVVSNANSNINSIEDLRGRRVAVGDQNSGTEFNARRLLNGHGITYQDIRVDYLGFAEAADALKAGKVDAIFITSGMPNASIMELERGFNLKIVPISPEKIKEIAQDQAYFVSLIIPKDTYGNEADIPTAAIMNALMIRADLSEDDGYKLTKGFFENLPQLVNAHQAAKDIALDKAQEGVVAPLHPGAQRYYTEQGL